MDAVIVQQKRAEHRRLKEEALAITDKALAEGRLLTDEKAKQAGGVRRPGEGDQYRTGERQDRRELGAVQADDRAWPAPGYCRDCRGAAEPPQAACWRIRM